MPPRSPRQFVQKAGPCGGNARLVKPWLGELVFHCGRSRGGFVQAATGLAEAPKRWS